MKRPLIALLFLLTCGPLAHSATVYMKDGSQVKGTIVSATAQTLQVHNAQGVITIQTEKISRVDYSESSTPPASPAVPTPVYQAAPSLPPARAPYRRVWQDQTPVWPQGTNQWLSLGFGAGIPLSRVDFQDIGGGRTGNGSTGFQFTPQYLHKVNSRWGAGFELDFFSRGQNFTQNLVPASDARVYGTNLLLMPVAKYSFVDRGRARPYVLAGVGAQRSSTVIDAQPNAGFVWSDTNTDEPRTLVDDAHWGLGTTLRLGVDFSWLDPSVLGFEVGWTHMENDAFGPTRAGKDFGVTPQSGIENNLAITFRWGWRF